MCWVIKSATFSYEECDCATQPDKLKLKGSAVTPGNL